MFSYYKIVFGIKHRYQISDVIKIFKQNRNYSIVISQHDAIHVDNCCDRPDLHYHGVVELINNGDKSQNTFSKLFLMQLSPYCIYINCGHCNNPVEYLAFITLAPKQIIVQEILNASKLPEHLRCMSTIQLEALGRKTERRISLIERDQRVIQIVEIILKTGIVCYDFEENHMKVREFLNEHRLSFKIIETALKLAKKIVLNSRIIVLSDRFEPPADYLSPEESAKFVLDWCSYQKLDPKKFVKNIITCLDKKGGYRNSIYLHGSKNSGKSYIVQSIIEACIHVGQVIVESSAYSYVWQNCVDKRLIVLKEPHFSMVNIDQLDKILSGSGTLIFKHNDIVDYLHSTPVIILANEHEWIDNPLLSEKIKKRFVCCYMDLKNFPFVNRKKLHPRWLSLLNSERNSDQMKSKIPNKRPLKSCFDIKNGMEPTPNGNWNCDDKSTNGDNDLSTTQASMNTNRGSENTMQPNPKYRKRKMGESVCVTRKKQKELSGKEKES